jgi:transcription antitermination factor NusG
MQISRTQNCDATDGDKVFQPTDADWFAFRVRPRHEKAVSLALRQRGCSEFLPLMREKRRWANRLRYVDIPMFPGYVFSCVNRFSLLPVLSTPGVMDVVRAGSTPVPANRDEIEALRVAVNSEVPMERCSYIEVGKTVQIVEGPLTGLKGILVNVRKSQRLVLSVSLLCRSVLIEIDNAWVAPNQEALSLAEAGAELGVSF